MSHTQAADGTSISYTVSGDGPPVVLVHGITEQSGSWAPITERLNGTHRVITVDLRGHGESGTADRYDLEAMAGDVVAVIDHLELADQARLVGHSLGGAVVSAVGAATPVASVVNVDQSLRLGEFTEQLLAIEGQLRDPATFPMVISAMFAQMSGDLLVAAEAQRISDLRRPELDVVLGVWDQLLTQSPAQINATIEGALGPYSQRPVPYLSLFGIDPGADYADWLASQIPGAKVEVWAGYGHYPHLVAPDRFCQRLVEFWAD